MSVFERRRQFEIADLPGRFPLRCPATLPSATTVSEIGTALRLVLSDTMTTETC